MNVVVRRIGPEAAGEVLAVVQAAFGARPSLDPPADAAADTEETIAADLASHGGLLATLDGRPVGALLFKQVPEALYLRRFGVVPDAQGYGVAAALVEAAVAAAIGHEAVGVLAREELPATIGFWERHGFEEADRRPPYVELRRPLPTSYDAPDADTMRDLGTRVGAALRAGDLVVLSGELGAGKTTFTQGLGEGLACAAGSRRPRSSSRACTRRWVEDPTSCTSTPTASVASRSSTTSTSTPRWTPRSPSSSGGPASPRPWPTSTSTSPSPARWATRSGPTTPTPVASRCAGSSE